MQKHVFGLASFLCACCPIKAGVVRETSKLMSNDAHEMLMIKMVSDLKSPFCCLCRILHVRQL